MTIVVLDAKFVYVSVVMKVAQKDLQHDLSIASNLLYKFFNTLPG
jgi:hypothetical protein